MEEDNEQEELEENEKQEEEYESDSEEFISYSKVWAIPILFIVYGVLFYFCLLDKWMFEHIWMLSIILGVIYAILMFIIYKPKQEQKDLT